MSKEDGSSSFRNFINKWFKKSQNDLNQPKQHEVTEEKDLLTDGNKA
jgi:hypothetical protein